LSIKCTSVPCEGGSCLPNSKLRGWSEGAYEKRKDDEEIEKLPKTNLIDVKKGEPVRGLTVRHPHLRGNYPV